MRRYIIIGIIGLVVIIGGWWLLRWLSFGTLSIVTNDQSAIVTLKYGLGEKEAKKVGKGDTTIKATPGEYTIEVTNDNKVTRGATTVVRGEESSMSLPLANTRESKKVADYTAVDLYNDGQSIGFLNVPQKLIYTLVNNTDATRISETYPVSNIVHWYNSTSLLFQTRDGGYYLRENGNDKLISITGDQNALAADAIDVNNKGEVVYVYQDSLYYRSSVQTSPVALVTNLSTGVNVPHVSLNDQGNVLLGFSPDSADDQDSQETTSTPNAMLVTIAGKKKTNLDVQFGDVQWSLDGKRFIATTPKGLELFSKNGASINLVSGLGDSVARASAWVSSNQLVYTDSSTIWLYDVTAQISTKLTNINGSINTTNPFGIHDNTIVYEVDPKPAPGAVGTIYKLDLR